MFGLAVFEELLRQPGESVQQAEKMGNREKDRSCDILLGIMRTQVIRDGDLNETPPVQSRLDGEEKA